MSYTTKDGVTILLDMPEGEKKETRYAQPAFVKACRGNERIAAVLDYFVYAACKEIKEKKLSEDTKIIVVKRTHEQILQTLHPQPARKSLIRYLDDLDTWKMVRSAAYKREFTIDLGCIQETLNNPPQPEPRIKGLQEKSGQITTLQPFESGQVTTLGNQTSLTEGQKSTQADLEKVVMWQHGQITTLEEKVVMLEEKVDKLQLKVDKLQLKGGQVTTLSGQVTTLQRAFESLVSFVQSQFPDATYNNLYILPTDTNKSNAPSCDGRDLLSPHLSRFSLLDDVVFQVAIEDWTAYNSDPSQKATATILSAEALTLTASLKPYFALGAQPQISTPTIEGNAEVYRLTSTLAPSAEKIVDADVPARRIEAETQGRTPALPVIDTPNNASNTVKKQGDANIPIARDSEKTAEKKSSRRSGKTKQQPVADLTPEEQARIAEEKAKEEARAERHKGVLAKIVARRGFALEDRQDIINEHKFINKLLDKYTDAQIDRIHRYLMEEDWKWSKVDNKFTIGAYIIWKESSRVAQTLRDRREQSLKDQREGVHRKTAVEAGTLPQQTRQPKNVIEAPKDWIEKRAAGGGK